LAFRNAEHLGESTFGVEITDSALSDACGLGNLDPQHSPALYATQSAIEAALTCDLPPIGSKLVVQRGDADALGAMAVMDLRAGGDKPDHSMIRRVGTIGRWDRFDFGAWDEWVNIHPPLPEVAQRDDLRGAPLSVRALSCLARDGMLSLETRIGGLKLWLTSGILPASGLLLALHEEDSLLHAWNTGKLPIKLTSDPAIVTLSSALPFGLRLAYRWAPVVIGETTFDCQRKFTVAQFDRNWLDLADLQARLNALEPGWGGSATLLGSPQGVSSQLSLATVMKEVRAVRLRALLARTGEKKSL
jgi:hypothetical protein